ncbi:Asp23/Gls24 family envelope stress response protein [Brevibacterium marinum]|uniref:Putative alkaline shock family protein YloU n=1 Tax=Brevibacterium marinum TaxID=418643 RepID=A0A846RYH7_9MICO|nr:putative alkaline shock family protein YloU [Brevibacterium marinum]
MASSRGGLTIADRVIEKTASQILKGLPGVGGTRSGLFGFGSSADLDSRPSVDVTLSGRSCTLEVQLGLEYPSPITEATESIRRHLSTDLEALTGVSVRQVDVDVKWLKPQGTGAGSSARNLQ